ncbi:Bor family protein [Saccharospirillum impatiens]|jgi:hypothetical protein|uniref:Bor family protein n=1 Tax=Saccharospirillum impatiens TaxID=169438 RepID=UPI0009FF3022
MRIRYIAVSLLVPLLLAGCATVTATPNGEPKVASVPQFEQTQPFYFWGLTPDKQSINVSDVCGESSVRQIQTQSTFENGFLSVITLGIYSPRTSRVWCE